MNTDQINSAVRSAFKIIGAILLAHGATKAAALVNSEDVIGLVLTVAGLIASHNWHRNTSAATPTAGGRTGGAALLVALGLASSILFAGGCSSTPQTVTYQAAATSSVTVETALKAYNDFAASGKTTPAQNAAVKAAFERYQAAFALVCDAGAVYSATSQTNAPAASAALQTAIVNANQSISDLIAVVQSFGVKL
jgi:hypothetical protein